MQAAFTLLLLNWCEKSGILDYCNVCLVSIPLLIASTVQAPFSIMSLALAWAFPSHSFLLCLPPSFSQTPPYSCPPLFSFLLEVIFLKKFLHDFSLCCVFFFFSQFPLNSCAIHKSKLTSCAFLPYPETIPQPQSGRKSLPQNWSLVPKSWGPLI